jgi:uncharacterized coiled-coil DUF342 family protein
VTGGSNELHASICTQREEIRALREKLDEINARLGRIDALIGGAPDEPANAMEHPAADSNNGSRAA